MQRLPVVLLAGLCSIGSARADVTLPALFGDHMVLQRDGAAPVWGTADPGEKVTVTAGAAQGDAVAGPDGKWIVRLANLPLSDQPIDLTVAGKNQIVLHDVVIGDVWICSGQSNMEFGLTKEISAPAEVPLADHPQLRLFLVPRANAPLPAGTIAATPDGSTIGHWLVCTPETVVQNGWGGFSAVGYYFGRDLLAFTHAPVGLIETCWSGTPGQSWTSLEALKAVPLLKIYSEQATAFRDKYAQTQQDYPAALQRWQAEVNQWKQDNKDAWDAYQKSLADWTIASQQAEAAKQAIPPHPKDPSPPKPKDPLTNPDLATVLFNGMIAPLIPYGIKGAVWYQGEGNTYKPVEYATLLPTLIRDWRTRWNEGDFPFLIVQLANNLPRQPQPSESGWAVLRESQVKTLSLPNTGLAVTLDLGEADDIHPRDKYDVGARLVLAARKIAYGDTVQASGPTFQSLTQEGDKLRLAFTNLGQGLAIGVPPAHFHPGEPRPDAATLRGFAVAGADGKYAWADAVIDGETVVVSSPTVPQPQSVRYAWADNPDANLYNQDGLPAVTFLTDTLTVGEEVVPGK